MRKGRAIGAAAALAAAALISSFAGCGLLPEEEAAPPPPVIHSYEKVQYSFDICSRGDVVSRTKATFVYTPVRSQSIAFSVENVALKGVYVSTGDVVKKGTLLAELEDGGLEDRIAAQEEVVANFATQLSTLSRNEEHDLRACDIRIEADPENAALKTARDATVERYAVDREALELRSAAAKTKLEELKADLEKRMMYAPFDGTVTDIKSFGADNYRSALGESFITISDKSALTFTAEGSEACKLFEVGDRVNLSIDGEDWPSTIVSNDGRYVSLEPDEYIGDVEEGSYGNVWVVLEASYDVLRVPSSAVGSANGQPIVYTLVDGVRALREVEVGLTADGFTEIISGLSEGEQVISK